MTFGMLRVALKQLVLTRPMHLSAIRKVSNFYPPTVGPDPNVNYDFYESLSNPMPVVPRIIGFEGELKALKEKEKGDWKNLNPEEKMDLYNLYFSKSMADMCRSTDEWKSVFGCVAFLTALSFLLHWFINDMVLPPPASTSTDPEWIYAAIKKRLQFHADPITGYASMWDYENNCWKK